MKSPQYWLVLGLLVGSGARASSARACGASATPLYEVETVSPQVAPVPLNAPIVVRLRELENASGTDPLPLAPSLVLVPRDGEGVAVELEPSGGSSTFVPKLPLLPNMTYLAGYRSGQAPGLAPGNPSSDGPPEVSWEFTTGSELAPTISLEGGLEVTFERGLEPILQCGVCGADCTEMGTLDVIKARVTLPRVVGGFEELAGQLVLTDNVPETFATPSKADPEPASHEVSLMEFVKVSGDAGQEVLITVPEASTAYDPCFAFMAYDARNDQAVAEPLCLSSSDVPLPESTIPNEGTSDPASADPRTSSGCSLGKGSGSSAGWLAAALLLGALGRTRRSRSEPAAGRTVLERVKASHRAECSA